MTNDLPEVQERGPGPRPGPPPGGPPVLSDVWVYNGRAYDLSDWIAKHPGGAFFIGRTKNRDITAIIASYHRDPAVVERILDRRYSLDRAATPRDIHPKHNAPPFLFKDDFNSWRDTPQYRFDNHNDLMHRVKARLTEPALAARIKRMDRLFNIVVVLLAIGYFAVQGVRLIEPRYMPLWAFVIAMVVLRSSLVGYGHYALHRAQRGWNRFLANAFDLNYIALSLVVADGHTLLHHPYTHSDVDIKKNVFTMMMRLPRLYRVPVHTLHKFGHTVTGMAVRLADVWNMTRKVGVQEGYGSWRNALPHFLGSSAVRLLLLTELTVFVAAGDFWAWALQFAATLWLSTFMVVASHEFEDEQQGCPVAGDDWGVDQVQHANDLKVFGNRYVDCFLSAGLSSHRVHHVLPFQRSGFANIVTEDVLREEAAKSGVAWLPAKSFFTDRLPKLSRTYLLSPSREAKQRNWGLLREHLSLTAWKESANYVAGGFVGIGSV
ncbi:cytochrome b5 domain-containing protein [Mycobacterium asiaticum]|uniref:cytochrome b5 domain-containing protein n=1 Tax=Mycobacterium asiaticum TaxID=1790 RepID=UPI000A82B403|nr:cytochrome b5 domain-containing protein [Mycobacterium asiaticum]